MSKQENLSLEESFINALTVYDPQAANEEKKMLSGNLKFNQRMTGWLIIKTFLKGLVGRYSVNNGIEGVLTIGENELTFYYRQVQDFQGFRGDRMIEYHYIIPYDSIKRVKLGREMGFKALKIKGNHQGDKYRIRVLVNASKKQYPNQPIHLEILTQTLNRKGFEF